ncbi:hypothetical protein LBBP_00168 [Leptospira borgpetersenii serovar Ballum]|uniref:Uncharacterized protein n=1 Tax=Leptospira borgpetersenii serovar Ballum TaxID=280505 RepID=A0A0S2ILK6_LEPBO|nr:hypothetical protein LBBP_00168 [Leptospira borgpetersenii serovar Ballum]
MLPFGNGNKKYSFLGLCENRSCMDFIPTYFALRSFCWFSCFVVNACSNPRFSSRRALFYLRACPKTIRFIGILADRCNCSYVLGQTLNKRLAVEFRLFYS